MQPYSPQWPVAPSASPPRERGFLLGAFLLLSMFGNMILTVVLVLGAGKVGSYDRADSTLDPSVAAAARTANHIMLFLALLTVFNLLFLTGAWMWKKWGVYGYGLVTGLGMIVSMRLVPASVLMNLVWIIIVGAIVVSKWRHFE